MAQRDPRFRFRPREMFFLFLGVVSLGGLGVLWMRVAPAAMEERGLEMADLPSLARVVMHLGFQIPASIAVLMLLSAGSATRVSLGRDRATWVLAGACTVGFVLLLVTVNALYEPLFAAQGWADS